MSTGIQGEIINVLGYFGEINWDRK